MIKVTEEIQRAYAEGWYRTIGMDEDDVQWMVERELRAPMAWRIAALAAVVAIVERGLRPQPTPAPARCADSGRSARNLVAVPDGAGTVLLGPTCKRRRIDAGQVRQALPIGSTETQTEAPDGL